MTFEEWWESYGERRQFGPWMKGYFHAAWFASKQNAAPCHQCERLQKALEQARKKLSEDNVHAADFEKVWKVIDDIDAALAAVKESK